MNHIIGETILLQKSSSTNSRFLSYLANQQQFIDINHSDTRNIAVNRYKSSSTKIRHGVPQGSVLGPLMFFLYISDLLLNTPGTNLVMFADNINVLITDSNIGALQNKVDHVIFELESWFQRNDLKINVGKQFLCHFIGDKKKCPIRPQVTFNKMNLIFRDRLNSWESILRRH